MFRISYWLLFHKSRLFGWKRIFLCYVCVNHVCPWSLDDLTLPSTVSKLVGYCMIDEVFYGWLCVFILGAHYCFVSPCINMWTSNESLSKCKKRNNMPSFMSGRSFFTLIFICVKGKQEPFTAYTCIELVMSTWVHFLPITIEYHGWSLHFSPFSCISVITLPLFEIFHEFYLFSCMHRTCFVINIFMSLLKKRNS